MFLPMIANFPFLEPEQIKSRKSPVHNLVVMKREPYLMQDSFNIIASNLGLLSQDSSQKIQLSIYFKIILSKIFMLKITFQI
jgi:hypothetical protein